jgi:hypothetical protein
MEKEIITAEQQLELANKRLEELSNSIIIRANDDRNTAKQIHDLIKEEIRLVEQDYKVQKESWDNLFKEAQNETDSEKKRELLKTLGRPPYKKSIVSYVEQLNRALEMSIRSSDNIVGLLSAVLKARTVKNNVQIDNIDNRSLILEEIIEEERLNKQNTK